VQIARTGSGGGGSIDLLLLGLLGATCLWKARRR
jgi:hypothetical protein